LKRADDLQKKLPWLKYEDMVGKSKASEEVHARMKEEYERLTVQVNPLKEKLRCVCLFVCVCVCMCTVVCVPLCWCDCDEMGDDVM